MDSSPILKPGLSARDWALLALFLLLFFGIMGWNLYQMYAVYATFPKALTSPSLYEKVFGHPGSEAARWSEHLKQVSGVDPRGVDMFTFYYTVCMRSSYCQTAFREYTKANPPFVMERWYWIALAFVSLLFAGRKRTPPVKPKAEAEWARAEEIRAREKSPGSFLGKTTHPESTFLGIMDVENPSRVLQEEPDPKKSEYLQLPTSARNRHILVVAGTGAGKTTTYAMNQIISAAKNGFGTIVFDQKWGGRSGLIEAISIYMHYGLPVYVFTPFSSSVPRTRLPVLQGIQEDDPNSAMNFAEMVIPSSEREDLAHYRENDQALLAGLIMAHLTWTRKEGRPADLGEVVDILSLYSIDQLKEYTSVNPEAHKLALKVLERPPSKLQEAIPGLRNKLLPFSANQNLREATKEGPPEENLNLEEVFKAPALLYVGLPEKEVGTKSGAVLLRILKRLIDLAIEKVGPLKYPYNFILDEFANFGYLPNVDKNLAMIRDQNVSLHIIVQSMAQGIGVYGLEGWKKTIENNVNTQVWYVADLSSDVQMELSRYLGETTILTEGQSVSRNGLIELIPRTSYNIRVDKRPLLSPDQMAKAPQGTAVVRLPNTGWTVFRAVTLQDPRNPFHKEYMQMRAELPKLLEVLKLRRSLSETAEAQPQTKSPALKPPPTKADRFREWVRLLLEATAPLAVYRGPKGDITKVVLLKAPPAAAPEPFLNGFLKVKNEEVYITEKGLKELGPLTNEIERANEVRKALQEERAMGKVSYTNTRGTAGTTVLVDIPSQTIFLHVSLEKNFRDFWQPAEVLPRQLQGQEGKWYALKAGPFMYGLLPDSDLASLYQEIALAAHEHEAVV